MAALAETETAHAAVNELSAKLQRLGMGHEAVPDDVLDKVQEILSKAGMQQMPGRNQAERKAALKYQLLETMTAMKDMDEKQVLDTCVYPVKEILEQPQGSVYLIVTLQDGVQYTKMSDGIRPAKSGGERFKWQRSKVGCRRRLQQQPSPTAKVGNLSRLPSRFDSRGGGG